MKNPIVCSLAAVILSLLVPPHCIAEEEAEETARPIPDPALVSLQRLEEQQGELMRNLQQVQASSVVELQKNAEAIAAGLRQIEASLAEQRRAELENQQSFNRMFLTCVAVLGGVAVLGTGAMAFMMLKTTRRVSELGIAALTGGHPQLLGFPNAGGHGRVEASTDRFVSSLAALEERLRQMEAMSLPPSRPVAKEQPGRNDG